MDMSVSLTVKATFYIDLQSYPTYLNKTGSEYCQIEEATKKYQKKTMRERKKFIRLWTLNAVLTYSQIDGMFNF